MNMPAHLRTCTQERGPPVLGSAVHDKLHLALMVGNNESMKTPSLKVDESDKSTYVKTADSSPQKHTLKVRHIHKHTHSQKYRHLSKHSLAVHVVTFRPCE